MDVVDFSYVQKQLKKAPKSIIRRLQRWAMAVENAGLMSARKIPGWHDELLKGSWRGFRSVRLGHKWRAIYKQKKSSSGYIVELKEVMPHEY